VRALLLVCGVVTVMGGAQRMPTASGVEPQRKMPSADSIPILGRDTLRALVHGAWSDRLSDIADGAFIDGRALYDLLGGGPRYSDGLSPLVLQWMDHDTSAYEDRPRRPGPMRLWVVRGAWRSSDGRVYLRALVTGGIRQRSETYLMRFAAPPSAKPWSIAEYRIGDFVYY